MKALKRMTLTSLGVATVALMASGAYNSMLMGDNSFMTEVSEIKFAKRLDEINGKVVVGRMAASTTWHQMQAPKKVEEIKETIASQKQESKEEVVQVAEIPEPAITDDLELSLSNVFHKKPLEKGAFSGSARTVDGVVEEINVNLPDGNVININTRDRMAGNVFTYEDAETRERKSGIFYEVKEGTYMINLTNDSKYAGVRMEFSASIRNGIEVAQNDSYESSYRNEVSWKNDKQNLQDEVADEKDYWAEQEQENRGDLESGQAQDNYGFNFQS